MTPGPEQLQSFYTRDTAFLFFLVARLKFLSQYPDHGTEHPYAQRQNTWRSRLRSKLKSYRLIPASFSDGVDTERPRQSASAVSTTIPPITWPSIEFDYPFKLQPHSWYAAKLWRIQCSSVRTFHVPFHGKGQATFRVCNPIRACILLASQRSRNSIPL